MPLKKISKSQSTQAEISKNLGINALNLNLETEALAPNKFSKIIAPLPKSKFEGRKSVLSKSSLELADKIFDLQGTQELKNKNVVIAERLVLQKNSVQISDNEIGIRVIDQKKDESVNDEDVSILAFTSINTEDVQPLIELVRSKKIEARIDTLILNSFFEALKKNGNVLQQLENKLKTEFQESEEIVKILNSSIEIKNKANQQYNFSKNSLDLANTFLKLLNFNKFNNSLEVSGEGHDGKITTIMSNLTSLPEKQVQEFDAHTALWFALSDILVSFERGVSPGYAIEQGKRKSNEFSATERMTLPSLSSYKTKTAVSSSIGDNAIDVIPNVSSKNSAEALEKVAYYCSVICNELRYSVGTNLLQNKANFSNRLQPYRMIGVSENPYKKSDEAGSVYDFLIFNDSKIANNDGNNIFAYADPDLAMYQNLSSFNFSKKNYIDNFYSVTSKSAGTYSDFLQQLSNIDNKFDEFGNYIKILTLYDKKTNFLKPINLFKQVISKFFEILYESLQTNSKKDLMNFIIAKNLNGTLSNSDSNVLNLKNLKKNIQLKTVKNYKNLVLKTNAKKFALKTNVDFNYLKRENNKQKLIEFLSNFNPKSSLDLKILISDEKAKKLFSNSVKLSDSEFSDLIFEEDFNSKFSSTIVDLMSKLEKECYEIISSDPSSKNSSFVNEEGLTKFSNFDGNTIIALLNECFYVLTNQFVDLDWAIYKDDVKTPVEKKTAESNRIVISNQNKFVFDREFNGILKNSINSSVNRIIFDLNSKNIDINKQIFVLNNKSLNLKEINDVLLKLEGEYESINNLYAISRSITSNFYSNAKLLKKHIDEIDASSVKSENNIRKNALNFIAENKQSLYQDLNFIKVENYKSSIDKLSKSKINNYDFAFRNQKDYDVIESYLKNFIGNNSTKIFQKQNFKFIAVGLSDKLISKILSLRNNSNDFKINLFLNKKNGFKPNKKSENLELANSIAINYELNFNEISSLVNPRTKLDFDNLSGRINAFNFFTKKNQKLPARDKDSNYKLIESVIISQLMHIVFGLELESKNIRLAAGSYSKQIVDLIIKPLENVLGISDLSSKLFFEDYGRLKFRSKNEIYDLIYNSSAGSNLKDAEVQAIIDSIYTLFDSKICTSDLVKKTIFLNSVNEYSDDYYLSKILCFKVADNYSADDIFNSYAVSCEIS